VPERLATPRPINATFFTICETLVLPCLGASRARADERLEVEAVIAPVLAGEGEGHDVEAADPVKASEVGWSDAPSDGDGRCRDEPVVRPDVQAGCGEVRPYASVHASGEQAEASGAPAAVCLPPALAGHDQSVLHRCDGQQSKIRMQETRVKISGRSISGRSKESRNGKVSRADKTA